VADEHDAHTAEEQRVIDDIHPPHQAAHSWRDIFVHLATITVGLFIALSLETASSGSTIGTWCMRRGKTSEARCKTIRRS
jgi:hypothetical protein